MNILIWSIGATLIVSLISLIGVFTLLLKNKLLEKIVLLLIGFSAGALIGGAFLHLIPESLENLDPGKIFITVIIGFTLFFVIEKFLHWRHCHKHNGVCPIHTFAYMNLIGDGAHNFIDGLIIAASFAVDINLGIATTLAVITHEIPQEISDFGVLIYAGFSKGKALFYNFLSAITSVLGAILGVVLSAYAENIAMFLLPFAAGGFIYISATDLIPELQKITGLKKSLLSFGFFILGILFMYGTKILF